MSEINFLLNANQFRTKNQFQNTLAETFSFPRYFGDNLDAVDDCMRDLSWFNEQKIIIQIRNSSQLNAKNPVMYQFMRETIESWQQYWQGQHEKRVIIEFV